MKVAAVLLFMTTFALAQNGQSGTATVKVPCCNDAQPQDGYFRNGDRVVTLGSAWCPEETARVAGVDGYPPLWYCSKVNLQPERPELSEEIGPNWIVTHGNYRGEICFTYAYVGYESFPDPYGEDENPYTECHVFLRESPLRHKARHSSVRRKAEIFEVYVRDSKDYQVGDQIIVTSVSGPSSPKPKP